MQISWPSMASSDSEWTSCSEVEEEGVRGYPDRPDYWPPEPRRTEECLWEGGEEGHFDSEAGPQGQGEEEFRIRRFPEEPRKEEKARRKQSKPRRRRTREETKEKEEEKEEEEVQEEEELERQEEESSDRWQAGELERIIFEQEFFEQFGRVGLGTRSPPQEEVEGKPRRCLSNAGGSREDSVRARSGTRSPTELEERIAKWDPYLDLPLSSCETSIPHSCERIEGITPFSSCHGQSTSRPPRPVRRHPSRPLHSGSPIANRQQLVWCETPGGRAWTMEEHSRRGAFAKGQKACPHGPEGSGTRCFLGNGPRKRKRRPRRFMELVACRKRKLEASEGKGKRKERRKERQEGAGACEQERVEGEPREGGQMRDAEEEFDSSWLAMPLPDGERSDSFAVQGRKLGLELWWSLIERATDLSSLGCVLAWTVASGPELGTDENSQRLLRSIFEKAAVSQKGQGFARGSIFPLRLGQLEPFRTMLVRSSIEEVAHEDFAQRWREDAWLFLALTGVNAMSSSLMPLAPGPWTAVQKRGVESMKHAVKRFLTLGGDGSWTKQTIAADLREKRVSYSGEEMAKVHPLTLEQVVAALPPVEHGGCIPLVDFLLPATRDLVEHPERLLFDEFGDDLPPLQAKIHCKDDDLIPLAKELVRRNICGWIEWSEVFEVKGQKVLSGMFGIEKSTVLPDGRKAHRLIMNLIPSNGVMKTIVGRVRGLPSITSWMSVVTLGSERIRFWQADMCSAFYLFSLPPQWMRFLSFNLKVSGSLIGKCPSKFYALSCKVLPMGWTSSVALMQEVAEQVIIRGGLSEAEQICKGSPLPSFLVESLAQGEREARPWWHCYLDNFCVGQNVSPPRTTEAGTMMHEKAEEAWQKAGIVSSVKKRVVSAAEIQELGSNINGEVNTIGISGERFLKIVLATFYVLGCRRLERKLLQIVGGRWIHALQFRRAGMCVLQDIWKMTSGKAHGPLLPFRVRRELLTLCCLVPLLHTSLSSPLMKVVTASDASLRGGAVGISRALSTTGEAFVRGARAAAQAPGKVPIFVVSLFNGIGGAFRIYDILGLQILGGVAVDLYGPANRVTSRRWPFVKLVRDVKLVDKAMCDSWALEFTDAVEVHLWAGFPCTDLSSAKSGREGLKGAASSLFYEIPRIEALLKNSFGRRVKIKKTIENVSSMERRECETISRKLGIYPYMLDCVGAVPMRRPRLCWCSESLEEAVLGLEFEDESHWRRVYAKAPYPDLQQWMAEQTSWPGGAEGHVLPTAMKAIVRTRPPSKPAGLSRTDSATRQRWEADQFRYPPYQYSSQFVFWRHGKWRLANSGDREVLLGYGWGHTELALSASEIKQGRTNYEDVRCSLLGDSFSIYSFVIPGAAMAHEFLPAIDYKHRARRMGVAPGFRLPIRYEAPLCRSLSYGILNPREAPQIQDLNAIFLSRVNHTGSDVRISSGEVVNPKTYPRQSVEESWWLWSILFKVLWRKSDHINSLELRSILLAVKYYVVHLHCSDCRVVHLTDSYVSMSIIGKGRTASGKLSWVLCQLNALLLMFNLQLLVAHVDSTKNPTDHASRE